MTDRQKQLEDIRQVIKLLGLFQNPDTDYKKGWNDGMQVVADDIKVILDGVNICKPIETSLAERTRLVKICKEYCISKRLDFCPTSLLAWMDAKGYLNTDAIQKALTEEKEKLENE